MTGRGLSRLCFGCEPLGGTDWGAVEVAEIARAIDRALELGIDFFDTADVYGLGVSEERLSQVLGARRHEVTIATKGGVSWSHAQPGVRATIKRDSSPDYLRSAVEGSLRRLRLDSLPIYYVHWPDPYTPIEATFEELERLRVAGKIGVLGCSNYSAEQLERACAVATVRYVQLPVNLLEGATGQDMVDVCDRHDIGIVAYNVLAQGLLSGKFDQSTRFPADDRRSRLPLFQGQKYRDALANVAKFTRTAASEGSTAVQYAIRWVLSQPRVVSAIVGIKNVRQLEQNVLGAGRGAV